VGRNFENSVHTIFTSMYSSSLTRLLGEPFRYEKANPLRGRHNMGQGNISRPNSYWQEICFQPVNVSQYCINRSIGWTAMRVLIKDRELKVLNNYRFDKRS
jgi:hypothetical protein